MSPSTEPERLVPALHRAVHAIAVFLDRELGELELTQADAHVLAHLAASGPRTVGELHRGFGHRRSTLTSVLDRLEARGYVSRELNPSDRRTFLIISTAEGTKVGRQVLAVLAGLEEAGLTDVSAQDVAAFRRVLAAIEAAAS
jgi:DNA-binding MarR family transcriptional regulator